MAKVRIGKTMECIKCGDCCRQILNSCKDIDDLKEQYNINEIDFILEHWKRTQKKCLNPKLKNFDIYYAWTCDMFDTKTNLCTCHDNDRPSICKNYPQNPKPETLISERCSYYV